MRQRIHEVRKANGLTMEEFGNYIGIQKSAVSRIESGSSTPGEQTVILICDRFGINRTWLETGEGEMLKHQETDALIPALRDVLAEYPAIAKALGQAMSVMTAKDFARLNEIIDLCTKKEQP